VNFAGTLHQQKSTLKVGAAGEKLDGKQTRMTSFVLTCTKIGA